MEQLTFTKTFTPQEKDSALSMGSGNLQVLATPSMIAFMENVAMNCAMPKLQDGYTTVGTLLNIKHLKASKIGEPIVATAKLVEEDGRRLVFHVSVTNGKGDLLGEGTHERFIVNADRFMGKL